MTTSPESDVRRVFRRRHAYLVASPAYEAALVGLAEAAAVHGPISTVVGIGGGGRQPAEQIAALLGLSAVHIEARHNATDALYTQATGVVTVHIPATFPSRLNGRVLLVDDICGTGATFTAAHNALAARLAAGTRVDTAALCRNVGSPLRPAWWAWEVDDWVVFPWEPRPDTALEPLPAPERIRTP